MHDERNKATVGKINYSLIDPYFVEGLACALTNGIVYYVPYSWREVNIEEYISALERHFAEVKKALASGKIMDHFDSKSELLHLDHMAACTMFLRYTLLEKIPAVKKKSDHNIAHKRFLVKKET